jgi:hypothetical protein
LVVHFAIKLLQNILEHLVHIHWEEGFIGIMNSKLTILAGTLTALWILTVLSAIVHSFLPIKSLDFVTGLSGLAFIIVFITHLAKETPAAADLPNLGLLTSHRLGFWIRTLLIFLGLGFTFLVGLIIGTSFSLILTCGLIGMIVTLKMRKSLDRTMLWIAMTFGLISALGITFLGTGDISWAIANLVLIPPAFTGGALLLKYTGLGHVRLLESKTALAIKGFLFGSVMAIPAALLNLLGNLQGLDTWIVHWWQPLYALVPALAEETWARLFLVSFCYAILRPVTNLQPHRAVVVAVLVSMFAHGYGHTGIDPVGILIGSVLYTLPVALLLVKRDFEHSVGYHFLIDFFRFIAAFLLAQA